MFKNYLKIVLRSLRKHKGYTFINVAGLAVGLAACILILLYVQFELSYDRFNEKADRIYRLTMQFSPKFGAALSIPSSTAPVLAAAYPEIEQAVRLNKVQEVLRHRQETWSEPRFFYADPSVFDVFSFPLLEGNPETALREPNTVVLTASTAKRYFGTQDALGKTVEMRDGRLLRVTGVAADVPPNSHLHFDFLASYATLDHEAQPPRTLGRQGYTYLLLKGPGAAASLQAKLDKLTSGDTEKIAQLLGWSFRGLAFGLQPLTDIHLHSHSADEAEPTSDIRYLYLFSALGIFILVLACVNYVNLATARSIQRTREVGVRKVLGAGRGQLIRQFLSESLLFTLAAAVLAIVLVQLLLPIYNSLAGKAITYEPLRHPQLLGMLLVIVLVAGFGAGMYPAVFLSHFRPALVLKGGAGSSARGLWVRRGLVTFQFGITIALLAGTFIMQRQLHYLQNTRLGFDTEQILELPEKGTLRSHKKAFKRELLALPGVQKVSIANGTPNRAWGRPQEENGVKYQMRVIRVDTDYLAAMGMHLTEGRDFDPALASDSAAVIVNETAARLFDLEGKVGQVIDKQFVSAQPERLIGIVSDFHTASLRDPIAPTVMALKTIPTPWESFVLRLTPDDIPATLEAIEATWHQFVPDYPFDYEFLDETLDAQYGAEQRLANVLAAFSIIAILVACLGLFGLAAFTAESRTKEIGIRKVLGASVSSIVRLLSGEFARLVLLAVVIAAPIAWFAMSRWLQDFAYHIEIGPWVFVLAGVAALLIALATVSYQAIKAALADPVKSLRYE